MSSSAARLSTEVAVESTLADDAGALEADEARLARLIVVRGSRAGSALSIGGDETTVGRATCNDVVLPDISVSRRHALLRREAHGYLLVDRDSGNGTRLNGRSVKAARLENGDEIALGDAVVQFVDAGRMAARGGIPAGRAILRIAVDALARGRASGPLIAGAVVLAIGLWGWKDRQRGISGNEVTARIAPSRATSVVDAIPVSTVAVDTPGESHSDGTTLQVEEAAVPAPRPMNRATPATEAAPSGQTRNAAWRIRAAYAAGDLTRAIALARAAPAAHSPLGDLERFSASWREGLARAAEHRAAEAIAAFERAETADAAIGAPDGAFSRKLRKTLASLHAQVGSSQIAEGQLAAASAHLRAALRSDPHDDRIREQWFRIVAEANDAYLRGYVAMDIDVDAAREAFRIVLAVLPASDATAQKAQRRLQQLEREAAEER